jgi:hypothetical protein
LIVNELAATADVSESEIPPVIQKAKPFRNCLPPGKIQINPAPPDTPGTIPLHIGVSVPGIGAEALS